LAYSVLQTMSIVC